MTDDNPLADLGRDSLHAVIRAWLDAGPMPRASDMLPLGPVGLPSLTDVLGALTAPTILDAQETPGARRSTD